MSVYVKVFGIFGLLLLFLYFFCTMKQSDFPFEYLSVQEITESLTHTESIVSLLDVTGFFLCLKGFADVSFNDQTFHIQAGDLCFYIPSTFLGLLNKTDDIEGVAIKCEAEFVVPLFERLMDSRMVLTMRENPCISLTPQQMKDITSFIGFIRDRKNRLAELSPGSVEYSILKQTVLSLGECLFHELVYAYTCNHVVTPRTADARDRIFQNFLISLFKNYKREREVLFYAGEQCLSPRYFSSIVKEKSGHSALQWIIQIVINSARQMLKNSDLSIKEIAIDFNFPSQSFFGKYFKQYVGVSPKEYRRQTRQQHA